MKKLLPLASAALIVFADSAWPQQMPFGRPARGMAGISTTCVQPSFAAPRFVWGAPWVQQRAGVALFPARRPAAVWCGPVFAPAPFASMGPLQIRVSSRQPQTRVAPVIVPNPVVIPPVPPPR